MVLIVRVRFSEVGNLFFFLELVAVASVHKPHVLLLQVDLVAHEEDNSAFGRQVCDRLV